MYVPKITKGTVLRALPSARAPITVRRLKITGRCCKTHQMAVAYAMTDLLHRKNLSAQNLLSKMHTQGLSIVGFLAANTPTLALNLT